MARNPAVKPDWNEAQDYTVNLSGNLVIYSLPDSVSRDFKNITGQNFNIYDNELFGTKRLFTVAQTYWDYKSRKLFF